MKKIIGMTLMTLLMVSSYAAPGHAGSGNRHLVQGIVIGTGAVLVGAALVNGFHHDNRVRVKVASRRDYRPRHTRGLNVRGQRTWAPPRHAKQWHPGHHDRRQHGINGQQGRVLVIPGCPRHR